MHTPRQNGMAFNALINAFRPELLSFSELKATNKLDNLNQVITPPAPPRNSLRNLCLQAPSTHGHRHLGGAHWALLTNLQGVLAN